MTRIKHFIFLCAAIIMSASISFAQKLKIEKDIDRNIPDTLEINYEDDFLPQYAVDSIVHDLKINEDSIFALYDTMTPERFDERYFNKFDPTPSKALWYSILFPGGGQIYNRKFWKLPIIYGGLLAILYGYNFNNKYYQTYQNAYRDLVMNSPNKSYMDFLPPNYNVEARRSYLEQTFQRKKNFYRTNRDYCLVGMVGVYLVAMVDAYVDAALYHFDVSTDLDANNNPVFMLSYSVNF